MIQVADNFNYRGKKPNFDRDSTENISFIARGILLDQNFSGVNKWIDATGATV